MQTQEPPTQPDAQPAESKEPSGQAVMQPPPPSPSLQPNQPNQPNQPPLPLKEELKGVGGWLMLFVITLAILSPIRMLLNYADMVSLDVIKPELGLIPLWGTYKMLALLLMVVNMVLFVMAGYRLCKHHTWRSVRFTIMAMWASVMMEAIMVAALYFMFGGAVFVIVLMASIFDFIKGLVYPTIWTLYLLKSKRVKNTYLKEQPLEELARDMSVAR